MDRSTTEAGDCVEGVEVEESVAGVVGADITVGGGEEGVVERLRF